MIVNHQHINHSCQYDFPNPLHCDDNHGLVAIGADLSPQTLRYAYAHGLFPWFNDGDPIMWWSPNPAVSSTHTLTSQAKACLAN